MGFSQQWDKQYAAAAHQACWPWSDVVSYVMRYARPNKPEFKVLELGCGAGANIPFFKKLAVNYTGLDGSTSVIRSLQQQYPEFTQNLLVMDFTQELPNGEYDLIIDRAALTHNSTQAIKAALELVYKALKKDGNFIGIDWFSTEYSDYKKLGEITTDEFTKSFGSESRSFAELGNVHFSDLAHLQTLFQDFQLANVQHKVIEERDAGSEWVFASYNFVATKR